MSSLGKTRVWMVGTSPGGKGGIASVIQQYCSAAFFAGGAVRFEASHHDGSAWGKIWPFMRCATKLWTALLMGRVKLVHAHASHGGSFWRKALLVLPAIALRVPAIVHLHGSDFMEFYSDGGRWRRYWIRFLFRRSFRVIALSEEWKKWILEIAPAAKVEVIVNSLPRHTGAGEKQAYSPYPTVLFLGGIGERKGAFDLLKAFAIVKGSIPEARLIYAGEGDTARLLAEADALDVRASIECVGWISGSHKVSLMTQCWVFALPSWREGLPMAILEAMAYSKAVVSCPVGGIAHAVKHGKTGFLVEPGDIEGLALSLLQVLSDRDTAQTLGRAARRAFEHGFSHDTSLPRVIALYQRAGVTNVPRLYLSPA